MSAPLSWSFLDGLCAKATRGIDSGGYPLSYPSGPVSRFQPPDRDRERGRDQIRNRGPHRARARATGPGTGGRGAEAGTGTGAKRTGTGGTGTAPCLRKILVRDLSGPGAYYYYYDATSPPMSPQDVSPPRSPK